MTTKLFYLAAPYTGTVEETADRMRQLCIVDSILMTHGVYTMTPLSKHFILDYSSLPGDWAYWQTYCELTLARCDGVIVIALDGWETSVGVLAEIELCKQLNIPHIVVDPQNVDIATIKRHFDLD